MTKNPFIKFLLDDILPEVINDYIIFEENEIVTSEKAFELVKIYNKYFWFKYNITLEFNMLFLEDLAKELTNYFKA